MTVSVKRSNTSESTKMKKDIQELIPEEHRNIVEAVPKGFMKSGLHGALLLGGLLGAVICMLLPSWAIPAIFAVAFIVQRIWVWKSDKDFDKRILELKAQGLTWKDSQ